MPGPSPRQHEHYKQYTSVTHTFILIRRMWKDLYDGQMIFGNLVGLKFLTLVLQVRKKPHPGNTSRSGVEPWPTAWQTRMLPPAPQWWQIFYMIQNVLLIIMYSFSFSILESRFINLIKISSTRVQHKVGSRDEMRWSPYIIGPWVAMVPANHAWCTITRVDEMKQNGWDECGEMVEWNL